MPQHIEIDVSLCFAIPKPEDVIHHQSQVRNILPPALNNAKNVQIYFQYDDVRTKKLGGGGSIVVTNRVNTMVRRDSGIDLRALDKLDRLTGDPLSSSVGVWIYNTNTKLHGLTCDFQGETH